MAIHCGLVTYIIEIFGISCTLYLYSLRRSYRLPIVYAFNVAFDIILFISSLVSMIENNTHVIKKVKRGKKLDEFFLLKNLYNIKIDIFPSTQNLSNLGYNKLNNK